MIRIFGAVESIDLNHMYELYIQNSIENISDEYVPVKIVYPEFIRNHPAKLVRYIRHEVSDAYVWNKNLDILTTSSMVFCAVRAELKHLNQEGELIQFELNKTTTFTIYNDGCIDYLAKGIFDIYCDLIIEISR